jgi:hypothetical protein
LARRVVTFKPGLKLKKLVNKKNTWYLFVLLVDFLKFS